MGGQQLGICVETRRNADWIVWVAVVLDGSLDPPVLHGRLRAHATEADAKAAALWIVERRYSPSEARHARWVTADRVPLMAHAAMTDTLTRSLRLTPARTNLDRRPPLRKRAMSPGRARILSLIKEHGDTCCWCQKVCLLDVDPQHPDRATVEHLVPRSKGGSNRRENLRVACYACNHKRGDMSRLP